jgi:hypothetical protein
MRLLSFTGIPGSLSECHRSRTGEEAFSHWNRPVKKKAYKTKRTRWRNECSSPKAEVHSLAVDLEPSTLKLGPLSPALRQFQYSRSTLTDECHMILRRADEHLTNLKQRRVDAQQSLRRVRSLLHTVREMTTPERHFLKTLTHLVFRSVCVAVRVQLSQVCGVKNTLNSIPCKKVAVQTKR